MPSDCPNFDPCTMFDGEYESLVEDIDGLDMLDDSDELEAVICLPTERLAYLDD